MPVDRLLPTEEARDLIELTRTVADKALAPITSKAPQARMARSTFSGPWSIPSWALRKASTGSSPAARKW